MATHEDQQLFDEYARQIRSRFLFWAAVTLLLVVADMAFSLKVALWVGAIFGTLAIVTAAAGGMLLGEYRTNCSAASRKGIRV